MMQQPRQPLNLRLVGAPDRDVDGVLRRYFRSQMPDPWPAAPAVTSEYKTMPRPRRLAHGRFFRLALAACVAALVIGYLAVQAWFPEPRPVVPNGVDQSRPMMRNLQRPGHGLIERTKNGEPVRVDRQTLPDNKGLIVVEPLADNVSGRKK